jgi:hypothetical protein
LQLPGDIAALVSMGSVTNQRAINQRREAGERQAKRDRIREQVASGELVIRKATAAERRQWRMVQRSPTDVEPPRRAPAPRRDQAADR